MIDLADATFLDSTALRTLVTAIAPLREDAGAAVVPRRRPGHRRASALVSGIGPMFTAFDTRPAAVAGLAESGRPLLNGWRAVGRRPGLSPSGEGV